MDTRKLAILCLLLVAACLVLSACATKTGTGAAIGGIGAALLTGNTGDIATGAAIGAGIGYLSEQEAAQKREEEEKKQETIQKSKITDDPDTAYRPANTNPFTGSTWRVINLQGETWLADYRQIIVSFQTNSKVTTMYSKEGGESDAYVETYGIVDDVLVFSGVENGEKYSATARYAHNGNLLSLTFEDLKVVLEEIEEM